MFQLVRESLMWDGIERLRKIEHADVNLEGFIMERGNIMGSNEELGFTTMLSSEAVLEGREDIVLVKMITYVFAYDVFHNFRQVTGQVDRAIICRVSSESFLEDWAYPRFFPC